MKIGSRNVVPFVYMQIAVISLMIAGALTVFANLGFYPGLAVSGVAVLTFGLALWHGRILIDAEETTAIKKTLLQ